jgi:hypothetical protein
VSAKRTEKLRRRADRKVGKLKQRKDAERRARRDAEAASHKRMMASMAFDVRPPGDHPAAGHIPIEQVRSPREIVADWIQKNIRYARRRP